MSNRRGGQPEHVGEVARLALVAMHADMVTPSELMPRPEIPDYLAALCRRVEREIRRHHGGFGFCWYDVMERLRTPACQAFRAVVATKGKAMGFSYPRIGACFNSGHVTALDAVKKYKYRKYRPEVLALADRVYEAVRA